MLKDCEESSVELDSELNLIKPFQIPKKKR